MEGALWLNSSYCWDPATLEARPVKAHTPLSRKASSGPACQVEGCGLDLSSLRYFFRKQRICEQHARADVVTDSAGRQLRFCQQCTRLEPLANFNGGRRSCKASLAKRQARAHRGKAHSSPDSSPERGATRGPSSSDGEAASAAASSWRGASRHSGAGATASKRSRGSPAPSAAAINHPLLVGGGQGLAQPAQLAAAPPPLAPLPPPDDMLWSSSLSGNDIEELLALDADALADALHVPPAPAPAPAPRSDGSTHSAAAQQPWGCDAATPLATAQPAPLPFGAPQGMPAPGVPTLWLPPAPAAPLAPPAHPGGVPDPRSAPPPCATQQQWAAMPEAASVASMRAAASGVAAGMQHTHPLYVVTRFSLKIFGVSPDGLPPQLRAELLAALRVSPTVLEGAIRCGCTHLIVDLLLSEQESCRLATPPRVAAAVRHLRRADAWPSHPEGPPAVVAQLGPLVGLGAAAGAGADAADAAPLPCVSVEDSQLLPRLALLGPAATTAMAARGTFRLAAAAGAAAAAWPPGGLAAALKCRCHARHVGLAVTTLRQPGGRGAASDDDDGASLSGLTSDEEEEAAGWGQGCGAQGGRPAGLVWSTMSAAEPGTALLEAWAPEAAGDDGWGLYEFELSSGSLLSEPVPVLVLPDSAAAAAAELCQLQQAGAAARGGATPAAILRLVAAVLRHLHMRQAAAAEGPASAAWASFEAAYPREATARVAAVAARLASLCVRSRWPALLRMLLPAVAADGAAAAAGLRQLDALSSPAPSILHLAVASGAADSVAALRDWAHSSGAPLLPGGDEASAAAGGGGGERPLALLLLAAGLGPALDGGMAAQLAGLLGAEGLARAADAPGLSGWSPRRVAAATGADALLAALPPPPPPVPAVEPGRALESGSGSGAAEEEEEEEWVEEEWQGVAGKLPVSEHLRQKLAALEEEDWPGSAPELPCKPAAAAYGAAAAAKARHDPAAYKQGRRERRPPSRDVAVLAHLLREMCVPPAAAATPSGSLASPAAARCTDDTPCRLLAGAHPLAAGVAGAAAAVAAALIAVAVRWVL